MFEDFVFITFQQTQYTRDNFVIMHHIMMYCANLSERVVAQRKQVLLFLA